MGGQAAAQAIVQLIQSVMAEVLHCASSEGGQTRTETGEIRSMHSKGGIYTALLTLVLLSVFMNVNLAQIQAEYTQLRDRLANIGWISQGYVQDRGPGAGGPCYQWTRKVKAKTVSVALSKEQYDALKEAIENWRETQQILQRMQTLSREIIFNTLPNPPRRKRLGKKVLGLI